jgi:hypothetical protein
MNTLKAITKTIFSSVVRILARGASAESELQPSRWNRAFQILEMSNAEKKCTLSSAAGIAPVRLFVDKSHTCRSVRLPIGSGICPVKLLKPRMSETTAFN